METKASPSSPYSVSATWEFRIDKEADIVAVRQQVRELAKEHQFDQFAVAALTTAASELSRNVWVHARSGMARIMVLRNGKRVGLGLEFVDSGPGIGGVLNAAGEDTALRVKEQQRVFRDRRPRHISAFEFHRSLPIVRARPWEAEASELRPVGNQVRFSS